ncbi:MAG: DUF4388 domain-containing protein [bacterium]
MSLYDLKPDVLKEGSLETCPPITLLGALFASRKTGQLELRSPAKTTTIFLFNGIPVNVSTTGAGAALLDLAAKDKKLSSEDILQVKQLARDKDMDYEQCLKMVCEVSESRLYYYKALAARQTIIEAVGMRSGKYGFTKSDDGFAEIEMFDLNPLDIIYEGMVSFHLTDLFQEIYRLGEEKVMLNKELKDHFLLPAPLFEKSHILDFFQNEVKLKKAVNIFQEEMQDINLALYALYLLIVTRVLTFVSRPVSETEREGKEPSREAPFETAPMPEDGHARAGGREAEDKRAADTGEEISTDYIITRSVKEEVSVPEKDCRPGPKHDFSGHERKPAKGGTAEKPFDVESPKLKSTPARPPEDGPDPKEGEREKRAQEVKRTVEAEKERIDMALNLYDLLGVSLEEEAEGIVEAYTDRRRRLEELEVNSDTPQELLDMLQEVFTRLEEAYYVLVDPDKRFEYEKGLAEAEEERAYKMPLRVSLAQKMHERGKWYMKHNCPGHAREFFSRTLDLNAKEAEYYTDLGWAIFRAREGGREAKDYLYSALKIDQGLTKAYYYLGVIAKQESDYEQAEEMFNKALELDPEEPSVQRELAYLNQKRKQTGIWQKIFGAKQ